jgi:hypothetical protein
MHRFTKASNYIESLRHPAKKRYAKDYYQYLRCPANQRPERGPEHPGLSYMAAQAVRMNLDEIMGE